MSLDVLREMIGAHESFHTNLTNKLLFACMNASVTMQFVATSKLFRTKRKVTRKRLFASVPTQVRFQMRRLAILFAATGMMTAMKQFLWCSL